MDFQFLFKRLETQSLQWLFDFVPNFLIKKASIEFSIVGSNDTVGILVLVYCDTWDFEAFPPYELL